MFQIEKNAASALPSKSKYPFNEMEVGDSFAFPDDVRLKGTVRTQSHYYGLKLGMKFSVRKNGDSYRCWRIA